MNSIVHRLLTCGTLVVASGCTSETPPPAASVPASAASAEAPISDAMSKAVAQQVARQVKAAVSQIDTGQKQATPQIPFEPPFLHRQNPFAPPAGAMMAGADRRSSGGSHVAAEVSLKGFASVGGTLRALLAVDGALVPLAEGQEKDDLRLVKLAPPSVVVRRGDVQWTLSLDNGGAPAQTDPSPAPSGPSL